MPTKQTQKSEKKQSKPRATATSGKPRRTREAPAAVFSDEASRIGMRDLRSHTMSWVAGTVYVGDGTNGATDSVYFATQGANAAVPGTSGGGQVPILSGDTRIGASYVNDVIKHYSRKIVKKCTLTFVSLQPSTTNSCVVMVAPVRGAGQAGDTTTFWGATTAAPTQTNTLGMSGSCSFASWEKKKLDLSPYIAGGSGAQQNEFNISKDAESSDTYWGAGAMDLTGISPCGFVVTGKNATAALRGTSTHYVVVTQVVDLLDFIGGNSIAQAEALAMRVSRKEVEDFVAATASNVSLKAHPLRLRAVEWLQAFEPKTQ